MEENDKRQLEGLLQARSEDLRHGRRPRTRRPVADPPPERRAPGTEARQAPASGRHCEGCGEPIGTRRLRAMPGATRCLECQRAAEHAAVRS